MLTPCCRLSVLSSLSWGDIDYSLLRWCILTGTDCLEYAEQYRVNSSDADGDLLTDRPYRRPLSNHTSVCLQYWTLSAVLRQDGLDNQVQHFMHRRNYKGGPHRVSKKSADFRCRKRTLWTYMRCCSYTVEVGPFQAARF